MGDFGMLRYVDGKERMAAANLTTKEVARLLLVSEATVKRWADDGLLVSVHSVMFAEMRATEAPLGRD